jgi:hypothetical protein
MLQQGIAGERTNSRSGSVELSRRPIARREEHELAARYRISGDSIITPATGRPIVGV